MRTYSADELAAAAGVGVSLIRRMTEAHVLDAPEGSYRPHDIARVRIAEAMDRAGIRFELLHDLIEDGRYSMAWIDAIFPDPVPMAGLTLRAAGEQLGIPVDRLRRFFTMSLQVPAPELDAEIREDDLELLRIFALMSTVAERDPDRLIAGTRFIGENLRRLATSQIAFFREHVEQPMFDAGMSTKDVLDTAVPIASAMLEISDRLLQLIHHRHFEHAGTEEIVTNIEIAMDEAGVRRRDAGREPAIAFLDLSDSTSVTDERGDAAALSIAEGLVELSAAAEARGGRTVKFLGDGIMLHFADPRPVAEAALELVETAPVLGLPPARVGASVGPVLHRDGDYFGRTVIIAARLAGHAVAREVLLTDAAAAVADGVAFDDAGDAVLKGLAEPVPVRRARRL
ncbi:MAG TPA: adenylate/guanylate cyclase domain-containing protein [Actinomycetota bacterium]|nr:adenylate/guanylate cyclase domain-containing protein [Actinomycetota bacterium]